MGSRRILAYVTAVSLASPIPAFAIEGRIPIFVPTTITAPGAYVVTQDISVGSGHVLVVTSGAVTIDLNGHTLSSAIRTFPGNSQSGNSIIHVNLSSSQVQDVVFRNGRLEGGFAGVADDGATITYDLRLEKTEITASRFGVHLLEFGHAEILGCHLHHLLGLGVVVQGESQGSQGSSVRIEDSTLDHLVAGGMSLTGIRGSLIRNNVVRDYGTTSAGIALSGAYGMLAGGNIIQGNTVAASSGGTTSSGIALSESSSTPLLGDSVLDNNVMGAGTYGIWSTSSHTRIVGNVTESNGADGIRVGDNGLGSNNFIESNQSQGNGGCGINFLNTNAHAFRNNMVRGNTGAGVCGGAVPNSDLGGNVL